MNTIENLIQKMNMRRFSWMGLSADLKMSFTTSEQKKATCQGSLKYLRLEEKMLLECRNKNNEALFIFKTEDIQFELYLPMQKQLYRGNIFDLENNDVIHSHITPFDLYRALKPLSPKAEDVTLSSANSDETVLMVWDHEDDIDYVIRKVSVNPKGQVTQDQFFNSKSIVKKDILRTEFKAIELDKKKQQTFSVPHNIRIIDNIKGQTTNMLFSNIELIRSKSEIKWDLKIAPDTEIFIFPKVKTSPKNQNYFN